jgi:hypothetical protein
MTNRLSEQLSDLSARTKSAEQALDAAEKEAHDKIAARKEQAHAAPTKRSKRSIKKSSRQMTRRPETGPPWRRKLPTT